MSIVASPQPPFALSLSKGCSSSFCVAQKAEQGFDKLSPSGFAEPGAEAFHG